VCLFACLFCVVVVVVVVVVFCEHCNLTWKPNPSMEPKLLRLFLNFDIDLFFVFGGPVCVACRVAGPVGLLCAGGWPGPGIESGGPLPQVIPRRIRAVGREQLRVCGCPEQGLAEPRHARGVFGAELALSGGRVRGRLRLRLAGRLRMRRTRSRGARFPLGRLIFRCRAGGKSHRVCWTYLPRHKYKQRGLPKKNGKQEQKNNPGKKRPTDFPFFFAG
jgi:hypothetical protein